jgi:hypothetical protein
VPNERTDFSGERTVDVASRYDKILAPVGFCTKPEHFKQALSDNSKRVPDEGEGQKEKGKRTQTKRRLLPPLTFSLCL